MNFSSEKCLAELFYRPASAGTPKEDDSAINESAGLYVVCDGVSGPYSPSNTGLDYGGQTGGQMVSRTICKHVAVARPGSDIRDVLLRANFEIFHRHREMGKDPGKEAVAGACVAACQVKGEEISFVLIADCFALYAQPPAPFCLLTDFDESAFDFEKKGDDEFAKCLQEAAGHKGKAWDLYFGYFAGKQRFRANQNLGNGGHAMVNGDPRLQECWKFTQVRRLEKWKWILLATDGLISAISADPRNRLSLAKELGDMCEEGGLPAILKWRDEQPSQPHIGAGYPEASAIKLTFQ